MCIPPGEHLVKGRQAPLVRPSAVAPVRSWNRPLQSESSTGWAARPFIGVPTSNLSMSSASLEAGWRAVTTGDRIHTYVTGRRLL